MSKPEKETYHRLIIDMMREIRVSANTVIGTADILLRGIAGPISETQKADLRVAARASQEIIRSTAFIANVIRLDREELFLDFVEIDFGQLLREVISPAALEILPKYQQDRLKRWGLNLRFPEELPKIWADERTLKQIVQYLLMDFHPFDHDLLRPRVSMMAIYDALTVTCYLTTHNDLARCPKFSEMTPVKRSTKILEALESGPRYSTVSSFLLAGHGGELRKTQQKNDLTYAFKLPITDNRPDEVDAA